MNRGRSTLILLALAAALGAYIWFVEMKREVTDEDAPKTEKVFTDLKAEAIAALELHGSNGDRTRLKKQGVGWTIESPVQVPADATEVSGVTSNLASLDLTRVIDEKPANLETFGLHAPRVSVTFTAGTTTRTLLLGSKTATGGDTYAKLADAPRVFTVPSWLEQSLDRTTFQLRNKAIVTMDREAVDHLAIIGAPGTIELKKQGDDWRLVQPLQARADAAEVSSLLTRLSSGQMQAIVAEQPATLDTYGLQPARTTVTAMAGGKTLAQVFVGSPSGDTAVHMKDAARPIVFTVEKGLADDLQRAAAAYRAKDVFAYRMFNLSRLVLMWGDDSRTFEKKKAGTGATATETWVQVAPADTSVKAATIDDIASRLGTLRAEGWVEAVPAGATPVLSAVATFGSGTQERVAIVQANNRMYATRDGEPGAATLGSPAVNDVLSLLAPAASTPTTAAPSPASSPAPGTRP
ncbi:hypothetical protein TBR22_A07110 [Luteitalea sp. TBR-22]|uniref:DUF4340 domain-containing protein n=1 Tax=Luteitalea sp. TBR-22 TaxID=2802971 RepID=UPI001AF0974C|nr:DUF4340 domain-containing protein [Luteitalea sp. TBR-22]BCS31510.1 hypothetical protein TBR22_A07110 [Luteitalea sp. TBR-22]